MLTNQQQAALYYARKRHRLLASGGGGAGLVPSTITDLVATAASDTEIDLTFSAATNAVRYEYRLRLSPSGAWTGWASLDVSGHVTGLSAGTAYDFEVRGVSDTDRGDPSNIATATTTNTGASSPLLSDVGVSIDADVGTPILVQ